MPVRKNAIVPAFLNKKTMIKNIVFDMGGVVLPLTPETAWQRFESLGIKNTRQQMGLYGQTGIFLQVENGTITAEEFLHELTRQAREQSGGERDIAPITFEQAQHAWIGYVDNVDLNRLNNLLKLKEQYNVIMLSNTNPFIFDWTERPTFSGDGHPLSYYFHQSFYSFVMKDYKPSATIFQTLLREADIKPEETVFLDDGEKNVRAAQQQGIHGLHVTENQDWMPQLQQFLSEK